MKHHLQITTTVIILSLAWVQTIYSQEKLYSFNGLVFDNETKLELVGANVSNGETVAFTDVDGRFEIQCTSPDTLIISYIGYEADTVFFNYSGPTLADDLLFYLEPTSFLLDKAVVTSGRYEIPLGESTVSMELLKPKLIQSVNAVDMEEALNKVPGLNIIDGQPNIRGGSGYAYGVGSRVLVLQDDLPVFQPDAGLVFWSDLPIENVAQVEILKGASSTLYGSSALNGIVNLRSGYAKDKPEFSLSSFYNIKLNPKDPEKKWWTVPPTEFGMSALYKQKIGKLDMVLGALYFKEDGPYIEENRGDPDYIERREYTEYGRATVDLRYRANNKLTIGARSTYNPGRGLDFFYWAGDFDLAYQGDSTTTSESGRRRFNIDPYITYVDNNNNKHKLQLRYFDVDNNVDADRQNSSSLYYSEYQFQKNWVDIDLRMAAGGVYQLIKSNSELFSFSEYEQTNAAGYLQLNKKFNNLSVEGGIRYEQNSLERIDTNFMEGQCLHPNEKETEDQFISRLGLNYQLPNSTFLRASWGQGYRYPAIAERCIRTDVGFPVKPNPNLKSERGWSAEIGVKKGLKIKNWTGYADLAFYRMEYEEMIEFLLDFNDLLNIGFAANNLGATKIQGFEIGLAGEGTIGKLGVSILAGYTYVDPKFKEWDITGKELELLEYQNATAGQQNAFLSSSDENILKYRFKHNVKFDAEFELDRFRFGFAYNYYSNIEAIDFLFEGLIDGIKTFRDTHKGYTLLDLRFSYKWDDRFSTAFIVKNTLNSEYTVRPALLEPPRNITFRLNYEF